jgi:hypothetical protein
MSAFHSPLGAAPFLVSFAAPLAPPFPCAAARPLNSRAQLHIAAMIFFASTSQRRPDPAADMYAGTHWDASLPALLNRYLVPVVWIEQTTYRLQGGCSTTELNGPCGKVYYRII